MKIVHHLYDPNVTHQVAFNGEGNAVTALRRNGWAVRSSVLLPGHDRFTDFTNIVANGESGFTCVATREYLRAVGGPQSSQTQMELEALFGNIGGNSVERMSTEGRELPLRLAIDASCLTRIRPSRDGRYIAVGNADGQIELWNMDMEPYRLYSHMFANHSIADMCFTRTNLALLLTTTGGGTYWLDRVSDRVIPLNDEVGWPCYTIDTQAAGDGIVLGGEGAIVWFVNMGRRQFDQTVTAHHIPFGMTEAESFTGLPYRYVTGMPGASLGCIRTGVGHYVHQVRFLTDDLVCVMGTHATEVWNLGEDEPRMVARREHDSQSRLFGFGGTHELVRVGLGRVEE